jgi:hypothetical protein
MGLAHGAWAEAALAAALQRCDPIETLKKIPHET